MSDVARNLERYDAEAHYSADSIPIEHAELTECTEAFENVGWTLGNDCPYRCKHCYSMSARRKGMNIEKWMVDRIVGQLVGLKVRTVNLGGNEPIFTCGTDPRETLLPYIIRSLVENGIRVGLTTSGITLVVLARRYSESLRLLNDVDVSLDSPFEDEHNANRGAPLFGMALEALGICQQHRLERTIVVTAMSWNFSSRHIDELVKLAAANAAHLRVNALKPVAAEHRRLMPDAMSFYSGFRRLMLQCEQVELGEPLLASLASQASQGCPCGRKSFRIHSITPDGRIPVSPCVYLHDYKTGDLLRDEVGEIVASLEFKTFRRRAAHPEVILDCAGCQYLDKCRGGCAARSYLCTVHSSGVRSLFTRDPYCLRSYLEEDPERTELLSFHFDRWKGESVLVHRNYLCTWIGKPKA